MVAILAAGAVFSRRQITMEDSRKMSDQSKKDVINQPQFRPSDFTAHFDERERIQYSCKLARLDISDPYHAPGVLFTTG